MFGWKRRRARKAAQRALGGAHLDDAPPAKAAPREEPRVDTTPSASVADVVEWPAEDEPTPDANGPGPEEEPEAEPDEVKVERPMVDLLTDGERLGFDPELHIPDDAAR